RRRDGRRPGRRVLCDRRARDLGSVPSMTTVDAVAPPVDLARIEEASLNALQTQRQLFYDGWVLRVSPGAAKRARSVNPHFGSTLPLAEKIAYCESLYARTSLPVLFRMTPFARPAELADTLQARGYQA